MVFLLYHANVTKKSDCRTREQLIPLPSDKQRAKKPTGSAEEANAFIAAIRSHASHLETAQP